MSLEDEIDSISGVGKVQAAKFKQLGLNTIADLIDYYPRRYEDYSLITPVNRLRPGMISLKATIKQAKGRYVRRGLHITEAIASDETGSVRLIWFNQPYRAAALKKDTLYFISGNYELARNRFSLMNPSVEIVSDLPANTARILAVYRETKGLDSRQIRLAIKNSYDDIKAIKEDLPAWLVKDLGLLAKSDALINIHMPESTEALSEAKHRLGFEEIFNLSLASQLNKEDNAKHQALVVDFNEILAKDFVKHLPFKLTDGQRLTIWRICQDMQKDIPMNRLVEGDVGSGKTVVATMAALMVLANNKQVAMMAPTEILARQHAETVYSLLKPLGYDQKVALLVGSMNNAQKAKAREVIKAGSAGIIIGTQALIQESVDMHSLALVVIDEQHRFGVEQRKSLMKKAGFMPHVLSLSATPIPRSLALTLYGELSISRLDEKPAKRQPITTSIIWPSERERLFKAIDSQLKAGRQMFVVCPSISDSTLIDVKSVEATYEEFSKGPFKSWRIGLLHGRLKAEAKQQVMQDFLDNKLDILVSTTVIEVGVDVPNASTMMIMSPERFGLAQMHQLRGRVGRGEHPGFCYLMLEESSQPTKRLRALVSSNDGFKLAELDLNLRGPGAIYGTSQHGALDLRLAQLNDTKLINEAVRAARSFIDRGEHLLKYKELNKRVSTLRTVTNLN